MTGRSILVVLASVVTLLASGCNRDADSSSLAGSGSKSDGGTRVSQSIDIKPAAGDAKLLDELAEFERKDMGVKPTDRLHSGEMHGPTPTSIPGGTLITTKGLLPMMRGQVGDPPIVFDVLGGPQTLPNAVPAVQAAQPGDFNDRVQQQFAQLLKKATRDDALAPLVFYCQGPMCWMSYNAALRAIKLGYQNVMWYRGGVDAWQRATQPIAIAKLESKPENRGQTAGSRQSAAPRAALAPVPTPASAPVSSATAPAIPQPQQAASPQLASASRAGMPFTTYEVKDPNFGGMRVSTVSIPVGWRASSEVRWDFTSSNYPVRVHFRAQSPDGKMWVDLLPMDAVYWMDRTFGTPPPLGQRSYGAVYAPNASIEQAMRQLVVQPARGKMPGFQVTAKHPVDPIRLSKAFGGVNWRGEAMSMRVRYTVNGAQADEDIYSFYSAVQAIPYTGPQGTTHEYHRMLLLSHAFGATDGLLASAYPLLTSIVTSVHNDEQYERHILSVKQHITAQYNAALKRGYDSIAAAGQLSRTISANNDALLSSMQQQRAAQNRADAARRATAAGSTSSNDAFSQYMRGTTRMEDPYWGTSERDSNYSHHWTDGQGNYRASNDASFNPNIGGGGPNWQRMEPAR
jgi:rhodanese-related sulfurtransferase